MAHCDNKQLGGGDGCNYVFGIDDARQNINCIKVETFNMEETPEFESEGQDDNGNTVAVVRGPSKFTATISGYLEQGANLACAACTLQIPGDNGGEFYVEKFSINASNNDFKKADITAVRYPQAQVCCP